MSMPSLQQSPTRKRLVTRRLPTPTRLQDRVACAQELPEEVRQQCLERLNDYEIKLAEESAARAGTRSALEKIALKLAPQNPVGQASRGSVSPAVSSSSGAESGRESSRKPTNGSDHQTGGRNATLESLARSVGRRITRSNQQMGLAQPRRDGGLHALDGIASKLGHRENQPLSALGPRDQPPTDPKLRCYQHGRRRPRRQRNPNRAAWEDQAFWYYDCQNPFRKSAKDTSPTASIERLPDTRTENTSVALPAQSLHEIRDARRAVAAARDALTSFPRLPNRDDPESELVPLRGMGSFLRVSLRYSIQA